MSSAWWNLTVVGVALATSAAAQDCRVLQLAASDGQTYDRFGWGLSFDGHRSAIGAPGRNRVYVYELGQDSWSAPSLLRPYDGDRDVYWFGVSTAVHGDTVLVGSAGNGFHHFLGAVSVFERDATGAWNEVQRLRAQGTGENDSFGSTIAASDGWLFVGAPDRLFSQDQQGIVFVWRRTEGGWNPRGELHPEPSLEYQQFGRSVSSTERLLLVGASAESSNGVPNNGAAYLFERVGTTWVRVARVVPSDADAYARVGHVVSLSRGSDRAIVGAREAAYILERTESGWEPTAKLEHPAGSPETGFGNRVAIDGDVAIVGAPADSYFEPYAGSLSVFTKGDRGWTLSSFQSLPGVNALDALGSQLHLSNGVALVAAVSADGSQPDCGVVHSFALGGGTVENYCEASRNSTGLPGRIRFTGRASLALEEARFEARDCPPAQHGFFFYGPSRTQSALGDGSLCVAGGGAGLFRLTRISAIDSSGTAVHDVNLEAPPASSGPGAFFPGRTWNFQFWYLDPLAGGSGVNLTDAVAVTFCF